MKKFLAILMALAMLCAFAACGNKDAGTATDEEAESIVEDIVESAEDVVEEELPSEEAEEIASEEETAEVASETEKETEAASEAKTEATTEETLESYNEAAKNATTEEAAKAPATTDEILKYYNEAINKAATAGYHKKRVCTINSLEGGAILKLSVAKEAVYNFLGVGTKEWDNTKGKNAYMGKATLTAADVTSAKLTENGDKYVIEIAVKDGSSKANASGKSDSSPLAKTGLFCGDGDKSEYDYKNAYNIYYALNNTDGAGLEEASLKATKAKIKATINSKTGNVEGLEISFNFSVVLTNVKYSIAKISEGTGNADTVVTFSSFKY